MKFSKFAFCVQKLVKKTKKETKTRYLLVDSEVFQIQDLHQRLLWKG